MDEPMFTIEFRLIDENGYEYSSSSKVPIFESLGETSLDVIGEQLNIFLKQCGYHRKNDNILMEDLSDEEYVAVTDFLDDYRSNNESD